jgi:hypothetical protein
MTPTQIEKLRAELAREEEERALFAATPDTEEPQHKHPTKPRGTTPPTQERVNG